MAASPDAGAHTEQQGYHDAQEEVSDLEVDAADECRIQASRRPPPVNTQESNYGSPLQGSMQDSPPSYLEAQKAKDLSPTSKSTQIIFTNGKFRRPLSAGTNVEFSYAPAPKRHLDLQGTRKQPQAFVSQQPESQNLSRESSPRGSSSPERDPADVRGNAMQKADPSHSSTTDASKTLEQPGMGSDASSPEALHQGESSNCDKDLVDGTNGDRSTTTQVPLKPEGPATAESEDHDVEGIDSVDPTDQVFQATPDTEQGQNNKQESVLQQDPNGRQDISDRQAYGVNQQPSEEQLVCDEQQGYEERLASRATSDTPTEGSWKLHAAHTVECQETSSNSKDQPGRTDDHGMPADVTPAVDLVSTSGEDPQSSERNIDPDSTPSSAEQSWTPNQPRDPSTKQSTADVEFDDDSETMVESIEEIDSPLLRSPTVKPREVPTLPKKVRHADAALQQVSRGRVEKNRKLTPHLSAGLLHLNSTQVLAMLFEEVDRREKEDERRKKEEAERTQKEQEDTKKAKEQALIVGYLDDKLCEEIDRSQCLAKQVQILAQYVRLEHGALERYETLCQKHLHLQAQEQGWIRDIKASSAKTKTWKARFEASHQALQQAEREKDDLAKQVHAGALALSAEHAIRVRTERELQNIKASKESELIAAFRSSEQKIQGDIAAVKQSIEARPTLDLASFDQIMEAVEGLNAMQVDLSPALDQKSELSSLCHTMHDRIAERLDDLRRTQVEPTAIDTVHKGITSALTELKSELVTCRDLQDQIKQLSTENATLQHDAAGQKQQINVLEAERDERRTALDQAKQRYTDAELKLQQEVERPANHPSLASRLQEADKELQALRSSRQTLLSELDQQKQVQEAEQAELSDLRTANEGLSSDLRMLNQQVIEQQEAQARLKQEIETSTRDRMHKTHREIYQKQARVHQNAIYQAQQELNHCKKSLDKTQRELDECRKANGASLQAAKAQDTETRNKLDELSESNARLEEQLKDCTAAAENDKLEHEKFVNSSGLATKQRVETLNEQVASLQQELQDKRAELVAKEAEGSRRQKATQATAQLRREDLERQLRRAKAQLETGVAKEQAAQEQAIQAKAAQEKAAEEKTLQTAAQEKAAQDKAAQDKAAQEKAAQEKAAHEKVAQDKATRDKAVRDKAAREDAMRQRKLEEQATKHRIKAKSMKRQAIQEQCDQGQHQREPVAQRQAGTEIDESKGISQTMEDHNIESQTQGESTGIFQAMEHHNIESQAKNTAMSEGQSQYKAPQVSTPSNTGPYDAGDNGNLRGPLIKPPPPKQRRKVNRNQAAVKPSALETVQTKPVEQKSASRRRTDCRHGNSDLLFEDVMDENMYAEDTNDSQRNDSQATIMDTQSLGQRSSSDAREAMMPTHRANLRSASYDITQDSNIMNELGKGRSGGASIQGSQSQSQNAPNSSSKMHRQPDLTVALNRQGRHLAEQETPSAAKTQRKKTHVGEMSESQWTPPGSSFGSFDATPTPRYQQDRAKSTKTPTLQQPSLPSKSLKRSRAGTGDDTVDASRKRMRSQASTDPRDPLQDQGPRSVDKASSLAQKNVTRRRSKELDAKARESTASSVHEPQVSPMKHAKKKASASTKPTGQLSKVNKRKSSNYDSYTPGKADDLFKAVLGESESQLNQ